MLVAKNHGGIHLMGTHIELCACCNSRPTSWNDWLKSKPDNDGFSTSSSENVVLTEHLCDSNELINMHRIELVSCWRK